MSNQSLVNRPGGHSWCHTLQQLSISIQNDVAVLCRYTAAYERLAGTPDLKEGTSAGNAAEAATTLAAVADMQLKMGEVDAADASLNTSLDLLKQHPGQLPALQVRPLSPLTS